MHRRIVAGFLLFVLAAGFAPAPKPKAKPKDDLQALEGTWEITERKTPTGRESPKTMQVKIEKGKWSFQNNRPDGTVRVTITYTIELDTAKKPAWIDMESNKSGRIVTLTGVYELSGDTLKTCYALGNSTVGPGGVKQQFAKSRPKGLNDKGMYIMILKRVTKK